ncbi:MAG: M15 family metallopeptidase [Acidimicrobiales bacterium]
MAEEAGRSACGLAVPGRGRASGSGRSEQGSALPLMVVAVVAAGTLALQVAKLGGAAGDRARAQTAADAAALAGAADGEDAARALAEANGARLVGYTTAGLDTRVVVDLGVAQARGAAHRDRSRRGASLGGSGSGSGGGASRGAGGGGGSRAGLAPAMLGALDRAAALLGEQVPITSGYRSPATQQQLWDNRAHNPYPVAPPGSSLHERGLAVDVPLAFVPRLEAVSGQVGLCHPFPQADPVHFEVCQ